MEFDFIFDVDGFDVKYKLVLLLKYVFGYLVDVDLVWNYGI